MSVATVEDLDRIAIGEQIEVRNQASGTMRWTRVDNGWQNGQAVIESSYFSGAIAQACVVSLNDLPPEVGSMWAHGQDGVYVVMGSSELADRVKVAYFENERFQGLMDRQPEGIKQGGRWTDPGWLAAQKPMLDEMFHATRLAATNGNEIVEAQNQRDAALLELEEARANSVRIENLRDALLDRGAVRFRAHKVFDEFGFGILSTMVSVWCEGHAENAKGKKRLVPGDVERVDLEFDWATTIQVEIRSTTDACQCHMVDADIVAGWLPKHLRKGLNRSTWKSVTCTRHDLF